VYRGHRSHDNTLPRFVGESAQSHWAKVEVMHPRDCVDPADDFDRNVVGLGVVGSGIDLGEVR
jgi:hypothetical protein